MATGALATNPARRGAGRAVLLLYHGVGPAGAPGAARFAVSSELFQQHLAVISRQVREGHFRADTVESWWRRAHAPAPGLSGANAAPQRSVIICFDDGAASDYELAFPLLAQAGLPATFFVNTAAIGQPGFLDGARIREIVGAGMSVQSHGHQHVPLVRVPPRQLERDLRTSRHILQDCTGTAVHFLAAPYGFWNHRVFELALATGFEALCHSRPGVAAPAQPLLPRNALRHHTSARQLQYWLRGRPGAYAGRILRDQALWLPKQILLRCDPHWLQAPLRCPAGSVSTS